MGDSTDELQSSQQTVQINALFDQAASTVQEKCRWLSTQRRATVGIDPGQRVLSYAAIEQAYWLEQHYPSQYLPLTYGTAADSFNPADLATADLKYIGPANIMELAISGSDDNEDGTTPINSRGSRQYTPLPKVIITVDMDLDREGKLPQEVGLLTAFNGGTQTEVNEAVTAESDLSTANRSVPTYCECRSDGIHFNVINDQRRVIRVQYIIVASWEYHAQVLTPSVIDQVVSVVDSVAIEYSVISDLFAQQGDMLQSLRYRDDSGNNGKGSGKFWDRIRSLRAYQNTGQRIAIDSTCTFDQDRDLPDRSLPNWDTNARLTSNARYLGSN